MLVLAEEMAHKPAPMNKGASESSMSPNLRAKVAAYQKALQDIDPVSTRDKIYLRSYNLIIFTHLYSLYSEKYDLITTKVKIIMINDG